MSLLEHLLLVRRVAPDGRRDLREALVVDARFVRPVNRWSELPRRVPVPHQLVPERRRLPLVALRRLHDEVPPFKLLENPHRLRPRALESLGHVLDIITVL